MEQEPTRDSSFSSSDGRPQVVFETGITEAALVTAAHLRQLAWQFDHLAETTQILRPDQSQTLPGRGSASRSGGSLSMRTQRASWQPQISVHEPATPLGSQEIQLEGLTEAPGSSCLYPSGGNTWSQIEFSTLQIQQGMGPYSIGSALPLHPEALSTNYSRMQDNIPPRSNLQLASWIPQGEGTQDKNFGIPNASTSRPRSIKNTVYDATYEAIGLHVDPHLRMFVARGDNGNEQH